LVGFWNAIVVAAIFGIVSFFLNWFLFGVLGLATLGLAFFVEFVAFLVQWVVNAILLKITGALTSRLQVRSFGVALIASLAMSFFGRVGLYVVNNFVLHRAHVGSVVL
jgi:uncharacterized membrane protein YvlD (DUF360 family)